MSTRRKVTHGDPRRLGGSIAGPGGPRDRGGVVIDSTDAVLLDATTVAMVDTFRAGQPTGEDVFAMQLSGRINRTPDRTEVLYLMDEDGVAALVTELLSCASRHGQGLLARVMADIGRRMDDLHAADAVRPVDPDEG